MGLPNSLPASGELAPSGIQGGVVDTGQIATRLLEEGVALEARGEVEEALERYDAAIHVMPDLARAHFNRGNLLLERNDFIGARQAFKRAVELKPESAAAHYNLGNTQLRLGHTDEGLACCRRAIALKPDFADAYVTLGVALDELERHDEAIDCYHRALEVKPESAEAYNNLGSDLSILGRQAEAVACFRTAVEIRPDFFEAHSNLLLVQNFLVGTAEEVRLKDAGRYGELVTRRAQVATAWQNSPHLDRCLRIGFVSANLGAHPVGYFFEAAISALASTAPGKFQFVAYSALPVADEITARIRTLFQSWHDVVGLSDESLARLVRNDGIDILIDLSGHVAFNRLPMFAWKPAPVQVSWLGYFATTGVPAVDYLVADPWTLPASEEPYFTEKIWRLPETRLCFTPPAFDLEPNALPALRVGYLTFGCFNNLAKMNDAVVALWARILAAVPGSRLFLMAPQLKLGAVRDGVIERFFAHGISRERLILAGSVPRAEYLASYHLVDIALDPFPYTGGTTTVEALWMGVPTLTLAGKSFLSRQGVGLMMNAGLPDWVAADADDYVARATFHADKLQLLAVLRSGLRQQVLASPIFDASRFATHLGAALHGMWRLWCERKSARGTLC